MKLNRGLLTGAVVAAALGGLVYSCNGKKSEEVAKVEDQTKAKVEKVIIPCDFSDGANNFDDVKRIFLTCPPEVREVLSKSSLIRLIFNEKEDSENIYKGMKNIQEIIFKISKLSEEAQSVAKKDFFIKKVLEGDMLYSSKALESLNKIEEIFSLVSGKPSLKDRFGMRISLSEQDFIRLSEENKKVGILFTFSESGRLWYKSHTVITCKWKDFLKLESDYETEINNKNQLFYYDIILLVLKMEKV